MTPDYDTPVTQQCRSICFLRIFMALDPVLGYFGRFRNVQKGVCQAQFGPHGVPREFG
jgi:hypothetical protein